MRFYTWFSCIILLFFSLLAAPALAQTISISSTFDTSIPYSRGSSIAVPFHIDNTLGNCITTSNTFQLFLSDAAGNFSPTATPIATVSGFYATFINATIPGSTPVGTGYKVRVVATSNPTATIFDSAPFAITNGTPITTSITGSEASPGILGSCQSIAQSIAQPYVYDYLRATGPTNGSVVIFNELTQTVQATNPGLTGNFQPAQANYTIIIKATNGTDYATKAYTFLNNVATNSITSQGSNSACLPSGGGGSAVLSYIIDPIGLKNNYPGNIYRVTWGDGGVNDYTYCDLVKANGVITHNYTQPSCGLLNSQGNNIYEIDVQPVNPYCPGVGTKVSSYAKITLPANNDFTVTSPTQATTNPTVLVACTNTTVSFKNLSYPGQDPTTGNCNNTRARYTWKVDGVPVLPLNAQLGDVFTYTFTTAGNHIVRLELNPGTSECGAVFMEKTICIQETPNPNFTIPASVCAGSAFSPTNTFTVDNTCYTDKFAWTVKRNGTTVQTSTQENPSFTLSTPGTYTVDLAVTDACNIISAPQQQIIVDGAPTATLPANISYCGPQVINYNAAGGVSFSGTTIEKADTYTWSVIPATGWAFTNGTNLHSKFPQITFSDFTTYTVTVIHHNTCGDIQKSQQINVQEAPTVSAGSDATTCIAPSYALTGTVGGNTTTVLSNKWTVVSGGDGVLANDNTLTPTYTLGNNDKLNGAAVKFQLLVTTSLNAPCDKIPSTVTITFPTPAKITSASTKTVCSGSALNYAITSNKTGNTYTWTATSGSAFISGYAAQTTPTATANIADVLVNTDPNLSGTVVYTITPTNGGCVGIPFDVTVTVSPKAAFTSAFTDATICSGSATNILLAANATPTTGTKFTWTVTGTGVTGFSAASAAVTGPIVQTLTNTTTAPVTVTYTITPISAGGCPGTAVTAKVIVQPNPSVADANTLDPNPTPVDAICSQGATSTYTFKGNTPVVGTGTWTLTSGQSGVTIANLHIATTTASGLIVGEVYKFRWYINFDPACITSNSDITVTVDPPSVGGVAATTNNPVCYGSGGTITLTGNVGTIIRWERSTDNGTTFTTIPGVNTASTYNFVNLIQTTLYRAVVQNGSCSFANSSPATVTVNAATEQPKAGPDQTLCNQTSVTLQSGNTNAVTGKWTQTSGPTAGVVINSPTSLSTTVTGLQGGNVYTFIWTVNGLPPCSDLPDNVQITDQPEIINTIAFTANPGTTIKVCSGSTLSFGGVPTGGAPPYSFVWEQSTDNGTTWAPLSGQTGQIATAVVTQATMFRRTVFTSLCSNISNVLSVTTQSPIANNTITSTTSVICDSTIPSIITGSTPTGGDDNGLYFYQWQQSTDNGITFTDINGATGRDYQPPALSGKVIYRRNVRTTLCSGALGNNSNPYSIIINPSVIASFTANNQTGCPPFNITSVNVNATSDPNASAYTWFANGTQIGTGYTFPGYTIATEGQTVTIKLVVSSALGCADASYSLDFSTFKQSVASFTANRTSGCGPQDVNFTNTSTPSGNAVFTWSFGDGSPNYIGTTPPQHTFQPDAFGNDITYNVKLTAGGCAPTTFTIPITVYSAQPVAIIDPGPPKGCAPYAITVKNLSLGTNTSYVFYLFDENNNKVQTITKTDKSDAVFNAVNTATDIKIYTVYMEATNLCGVTKRSAVFPITIAPTGITARMYVTPVNAAGDAAGCGPFLATFHNLSTGGTSYVYNIYNSNFVAIDFVTATNTSNVSYNFRDAGTYYVSVGVFSNCAAGLESLKVPVVVYPVPTPAFTSDANTTSCGQITVQFTNTTVGTPTSPASSMTYSWDFGDGSSSNQFSPTHTFYYTNSPYTVTLTATNSNGCFGSTTKTNYIIVQPLPETDFTANPGLVVAIPIYTLNFIDKTKNAPVKWKWDFGDKITSTQQNPTHTYADTGKYVVTLTTFTAFGCTDSKTRLVEVTGVPGQLYIPNAFMPTSLTEELRKFTVKGSGLKSYTLRIFNNWGQMVFETSKLNAKGEPIEFWDGMFKGIDAPQGVYAWEVSGLFINGTDWKGMSYKGSAPKRAGTFTLIR